jgi:pimeloyl-ACP methyl ester carboxylesterase
MKDLAIGRHFATLAGARQIHYRRCGHGPAVLLLHQSPASSAELVPLMLELAPHYTVIAPDTPGNGLSGMLPLESVRIDDIADTLVEFMDAIALPRAAVYGFHTGAACAMSLAHRHPARISVAVVNGYTQMEPAELADIHANYLPPLQVEWNGAHLLWAWSRIRDQFVFFPWYARRPEARLATGLPSLRAMHDAVLDLLRAGDGYAQAYRAAFSYNRAAVLSQLCAPTVIMTARTDALYRYLDQMPTPGAGVTVQRPADYAAARQVLRDTLALHVAAGVTAPAPATTPLPGTLWSDFLQTRHGPMFALRSLEGAGRPLLFCHDTAGAALGLRETMLAWLGQRPLLAVDLPGNGESPLPPGARISVEAQVEWLVAALDASGHEAPDVVACGGGGLIVATALTQQHPTRVHRLLRAAPRPAAYFGAPIEIDPHGLHLLRVWNIVRDQLLFEPWHERRRPNVRRPDAAELDPRRIHARTLDALKCLDVLPQIEAAHAAWPLEAALAALGERVAPMP